MGNPSISVLIVEDQKLTRRGMQLYVDGLSGLNVIGAFGSAEEALPEIKQLLPRVVLMDIGLPGMDGISAAKLIKSEHPEIGVLMLTSNESPEAIFEAFNAGADGYILKTAFSKSLENAIRSVTCESVWLDPQLAAAILDCRAKEVGLISQQLKRVLENLSITSCSDGICRIESNFVEQLKRIRPARA
ncbi:MAG: response regulator transcription factor [Candidatus Obscuribacterales bacterium]|nr:response regulator transcription factor [Candidatus Obscuribacterales bacterium]